MAYRFDTDLEFLSKISSEDLDGLVTTLTHDKDGSTRLTEELTGAVEYKRHHPDHAKYWELVAAEVQSYGANTFATILRGGKGVLYKEVLTDVCDKLKVNYNGDSDVELIEQNLMMKIIQDSVEKMTDEEVREMAQEAGVVNYQSLTKDAAIAAFIAVFRAGGFKSFQILVIVVNAVLKALIGRGLGFAAAGMMNRTAAILVGPVGWVITGLWTAFDLASPAYRVTIPAVIQIIVLRQKQLVDSKANQA
ncbi:DUF3944 domain-containing protein [Mitsuaria sp. 7]|uniref:DUF3944 domain-containing protein n=1 Tax=Mitsuaria sp. 7 TaxID=1658665 RepID=UPI0007DE0651|nr:DUF3944 domain-containing protein [Mitsuaria sp. 7]ANH66652.1 hypothetical protein ABE85_02080 [Mitsuaria sp. 7]